jgi:hypothetical protein
MQSYVGSFAQPTSTGNQSITALSFTPQLVIFNICSNLTSAGYAAGVTYSMGAATSSSNQYWVSGSLTNATTDYTGYQYYTLSDCIGVYNSSGIISLASLVSLNSNGFTIDWTTVDSTARIVNYIAIGGISNAYVGYMTHPSTTGNSSTTGVGFQPDVVMVMPVMGTTQQPPTTADVNQFKFGVAYFNSTQAGSTATVALTGSDTTTTNQVAKPVAAIASAGTASNVATFVSMDSGGFTLDYTTSTALRYSFFIALKGVQNAIGTITQPSSTGNVSVSGLSFTPSLVFLSSGDAVSSTSPSSPGYFSFGAGNANGQFGGWYGGSTGSATVDSSCGIGTTSIFGSAVPNGASPTTKAAASLSSLQAGGFTVDFATTDGTAREIYYFALGYDVTTQTQSGLSRITVSTDHTQAGISRITATTTNTQSGLSRITVSTTKTQSGVGRITSTTTQTQSGVANIVASGVTTQTQTGVSRITATTDQTQTGVARVQIVTIHTQSGLSRISIVTARTQTGISNIIGIPQSVVWWPPPSAKRRG